MAPDLSTALSSLTAASKLLQGMRQIKVDAEVGTKVIEVQGIISNLHSELLNVRTQYSELLDSKNEIKAKLAQYENWDAAAAKYELREISPGRRVMALKEAVHPSQTPLYFCPNCFQNKKESVLQGIDVEAVHYECTAKCGFETPRIFPLPAPKINFNFPGHRPNRNLRRS